MSLEDVAKLAKTSLQLKAQHLALSGGEPTLHPDLDKIIALLCVMKVGHTLITNGVKLSDVGYLKHLQEFGLSSVLLSLNSLDSDALNSFEGTRTLDHKLRAIDNIVDNEISICTSISILDGFNKDQFKEILFYSLKKGADGLRVRTYSHYGKYNETNLLFMSDLFDLMSKALGVEKEVFYDDLASLPISSSIQYSANLMFFKEGDDFKFLIPMPVTEHGENMQALIEERMIKRRGLEFSREINNKIENNVGEIVFFSIVMFSWPSRYEFDLHEINSCGAGHLTPDRKIENFFSALIKI